MADQPLPELPKKPFWVPWFLDIPDWELATQVDQYRELPWHSSYRKISMLVFLCVAILSVCAGAMRAKMAGRHFSFFGAAVYVVLYPFLSILIGLGVRPAMIVALMLFTLDRLASIAIGLLSPLNWGIQLALWFFVVERIWKALRVEQARQVLSRSRAPVGSKGASWLIRCASPASISGRGAASSAGPHREGRRSGTTVRSL